MSWHDAPIENDDEGRPMFKGMVHLTNDKNEMLANVLWFYDEGPFYAHAMDVDDVSLIRRIGPHETLEGAKQNCLAAIEGRLNISRRAGYPRD